MLRPFRLKFRRRSKTAPLRALTIVGQDFSRLALVGSIALVASCSALMPPTGSSPKRDINAVLADHDKRLMAIPGVVGVYVGLLEDGVTPGLKVMLRRSDKRTEDAIPRTLEGYRVVIEVTGEIRPMTTK